MRIRQSTFVLVLLLVTLLPATAHATFPGGNGRILFQRHGGSTATTHVTVLPTGRLPRTVYTERGGVGLRALTFSPNGRQLLREEYNPLFNKIQRLTAAGTGATDVPVVEGGTMPQWSRGGAIFYEAGVGSASLYRVGTSTPLLQMGSASGGGNVIRFEVSPDGSRVAYVHLIETYDATNAATIAEDLWIANIDGSDAHQLTTFGDLSGAATAFSSIQWSPLGIIYFNAIVPGTDNVGQYRIKPDGTGLAKMFTNPSGFAVSPNGAWLTYTNASGSLIRTNRLGAQPKRIASGASYPVFSPNSQLIAFSQKVNGKSDVMTIKLNGTGRTNVTNTPRTFEDPLDWQRQPS